MKGVARVAVAAAAFLALAAAPGATTAHAYVLWIGTRVYVTADGHAWRNVTPRGAVRARSVGLIDAVDFRTSSEGWLIASDCVLGKGSLYRTADGGHSWRKYAFHSHSCTGGANFSLSVLDGRRAWLLQNEPGVPSASLARTTNGGRSWEYVEARLPDLGKIVFVSARDGWLAGGRLFRTADGGRTWSERALPAPRGYEGALVQLSAPHFFGRDGIVAGEYERDKHVIGVYGTSDAGRRWRLLASLPGSGPSVFPQFALSAVSPGTDWVLTAGAKPAAYVTHDGGRHWARHALAQKFYAPVALSTKVAAASSFRGVPYITRDGGRSWRRLKL